MKDRVGEGRLEAVRNTVNGIVLGTKKVIDTIAGEGIRREDWSRADQERMSQGQRPEGHPEHPNV